MGRTEWRTALVAGAMCLPASLHAQDRLPAATGSSESAAFQQQGLPAGGFRIYPTLRLSTQYDDNVTRSTNGGIGDGLFTIAPTIAARSQWSTNQLDLSAFLRDDRYFTRSEQNRDEYGTDLRGRLDLSRTTILNGNFSAAHLAERRGTPGDLFLSIRPIQYGLLDGSLNVSQQLNRIGVVLGVSGSRYRYENQIDPSAPVLQGFRDRDVGTVNGRLEYQYSAVTSLFVSASYNRIRYDNRGSLLDRSSRGGTILGGVRFELSRLLHGEIGVGYLTQSFEDPRFRDFSGPSYNGSLTYAPTALTTITVRGQRRLTDSSLLQVAGVLASDIEVTVEHELLRALLIQANAAYINYNYRGIARTDNRVNFGLGARYRLSRYVSISISGDRVDQSSGYIGGRNYASDQVTLSLILSR